MRVKTNYVVELDEAEQFGYLARWIDGRKRLPVTNLLGQDKADPYRRLMVERITIYANGYMKAHGRLWAEDERRGRRGTKWYNAGRAEFPIWWSELPASIRENLPMSIDRQPMKDYEAAPIEAQYKVVTA